jgi:hypothetical protein
MPDELLLREQPIQGGAADPYPLGDLGLAHTSCEGLGGSDGDLLHRRPLFAADSLQGLTQLVESATGFYVGCVGHGASVKHLPQSVNCVTLRASTKRSGAAPTARSTAKELEVPMQDQPTGPAGLPVRPFKPRCNFGNGHTWIAEANASDDETYQCSVCGAVSSNHPAALAIGGHQ